MLFQSSFAFGRLDDDGETQGMSQIGDLLMVRWSSCKIEVACVKIFKVIARILIMPNIAIAHYG